VIHASLFEERNEAGDGVCLLGDNLLERAAARSSVRPDFFSPGRGRGRNWRRGQNRRGFRKKVSRQSGLKMRRQYVNVGPLIHELTETDLDGKLLADGKGNLCQRQGVESLFHERGGGADLRPLAARDGYEQLNHLRSNAVGS
jgi:hypothetical protein